MVMRVRLVSAIIVLFIGFLGGQLLTNRHTVAKHLYKVPTNGGPSDVIGAGLAETLKAAQMDPLVWEVFPQNTANLIVLSNRTDRTLLYVRVTPKENRGLEYHLYRPK